MVFEVHGVELETTPVLLLRGDGLMYAARLLDLGLTAYARTGDEALAKLHRMYESWVRAIEAVGNVDRLIATGKVVGLHRLLDTQESETI